MHSEILNRYACTCTHLCVCVCVEQYKESGVHQFSSYTYYSPYSVADCNLVDVGDTL